jgi:Anti-sigma-K factor rskA/Putative zinc-finger
VSCARCRELLGGYVLQALEPDEAAELRQHLRSCPECRSEHAELAPVPALLDMLGSSDEAAESPPPALEEALLDRFARERRRLVRPARRRRRWLVGGAVAAAAVAGAVAVLALAGGFGTPSGEPAFGYVRLAGTATAADASAHADLHAVRAGTRVRLEARGLPAGRSHVYELWCVPDDGRWISGGTFRVDGRGGAEVTLSSAARPGDYELMLVTRRPERRPEGARGATVLEGRVEY